MAYVIKKMAKWRDLEDFSSLKELLIAGTYSTSERHRFYNFEFLQELFTAATKS